MRCSGFELLISSRHWRPGSDFVDDFRTRYPAIAKRNTNQLERTTVFAAGTKGPTGVVAASTTA